MKRFSLLTIACLFCCIGTFAQYNRYGEAGRYQRPSPSRSNYSNYNEDQYFGIRLGVNFTSLTGDDLKAIDGRTGLNVGIVYGVNITPSAPIYFETGLWYTEKGGKSSSGNSKIEKNASLNYLEMPLVFKYQIDVDGTCSIQPFFGGYLACGVGGKFLGQDSFSKETFKRFDGGIRLGCGLAFSRMYVEAAYEFGLSDISRDEIKLADTTSKITDEIKNSNFSLTLGLNF